MATKEKKKTASAFADSIVEEQVDSIDEALERINGRLKPYEKLIEKRNALMAARRALLGGNRSTGAGGTRLQQEDVVRFLLENPGSTPTQVAEHFSVPYSTVAGHLYRGKNERFLGRNRQWWVRDPENGLNSVEDIDDGE